MVKVTLLFLLLSAYCQPRCLPPIHLSGLPWLVVALPLVALHPLPVLSLRCTASFSCPLAMQPPPLIILRCRRLSRCHHLLSTGASGWSSQLLSLRHCRFLSSQLSTTSCLWMPPLSMASCLPGDFCIPPVVALLPPPLVLSTRRLHLALSRLCIAPPCRLLSAGTSPLVCLSFACWISHHISLRHCLKCPSWTPTFICTSRLLRRISSCCFCLPSSCQHPRLLTRW
jgi:hypothetical protein